MRERGALFSVMVFLLLMMVLTFTLVSQETLYAGEKDVSQLTALSRTSNAYDTINESIVDLGKESVARSAFERILPFDYTLDFNRLLLMQKLPLHPNVLANYFDLINAYSIFVSDTNAQTTFTNVDLDINTVQNPAWGGTASRIHFILIPQCMQYVTADLNEMILEPVSDPACGADFNVQDIRRFDLNVSIKNQNADYNSVVCHLNGSDVCTQTAFDENSPYPFVSLTIDSALCPSCSLSGSARTVSAHIDTVLDHNITLKCTGAGCTSVPLTVYLSNGVRIIHEGDRMDLNMMVTFRSPVKELFFNDINFSVRQPGFNLQQTNR
ncbi:MAG: hypothetical protein HY917_03045 [Candidatus Diapherotrites archaeon]|nr:hypothetical protein [Candidatus Diapherotrites archaeon]